MIAAVTARLRRKEGGDRRALSFQEVQELTMTVGYYMMVSRFLETFDVDIEDKPAEVTVNAGRSR